jgi:hypothetical protein
VGWVCGKSLNRLGLLDACLGLWQTFEYKWVASGGLGSVIGMVVVRPWRNEKGSQRGEPLFETVPGNTSPSIFRVARGEKQCKKNRRARRYEGHGEQEAVSKKLEAGSGTERKTREPQRRELSRGARRVTGCGRRRKAGG